MPRQEGALEIPYYTKRLMQEFKNSPYEACFQPPWRTMEPPESVWRAPKSTVPCFVRAVNCWVYLSKRACNPFIRHCLLLQIDRYLPRITEIDHCGSYASLGLHECLYWKRLDDRIFPLVLSEVLPPSKNTKDPILHLLSKALPQRCQIRNLRDIILSYTSASDEAYAFIMMILRKSLFGLYDCAKVKLCFEGRVVIYKSFVGQLSSKSFFTKWFRSASSQHQVYLFYCLKEYLINKLKLCGSVYEVLEQKWNWSRFHKQVACFMDETRRKLNVMATREYNFLQRSDWLLSIEQILTSAAKQHVKLFRTTPVLGYFNKLRQDISKYFFAQDKYALDEHLSDATKALLWAFGQRCRKEDQIFECLRFFPTEAPLYAKVVQRRFGSKDFHTVSHRSLEFLAELCRLRNLQKNLTFYTLPDHIYQRQLETLALKEREDVGDEGCDGPFRPKPSAAFQYCCFVCKDVKIFLMETNTKNNRHSNRLSRGAMRIVVDNQQSPLRLCCGRRPERHCKNSKRKHRDSPALQERKERKEKTRDALAARCIRTPCRQLDLLGHAFSFFGKLYLLCAECGNACVLKKQCFRYSTLPNCQTCWNQKATLCAKCHTEQQHCVEVLCLDRNTGRFVRAPFCNTCSYAHASKQPIVL